MADNTYCYQESNVLINKFNIKDEDILSEQERKIANATIAHINITPVKGDFDLKHLQAIHNEIFSDIYEWAGKLRTVNISKGDMFCNVMFLDSYSKGIFDKLKKDNYLIGLNKDITFKKLSEYIGDINALHPFREGNGRTQRQFIGYLAMATGIKLDLRKTDSERMMNASKESFLCKYKEFEKIFTEIAHPMTLDEQKNFLKSISKECCEIFEQMEARGLIIDRIKEFADTRTNKKTIEEVKKSITDNKKATVTNKRKIIDNKDR